MQLQWYGHACFLLTADGGTRILTDPCSAKVGYNIHDVAADAVTSSHDHYDHNDFSVLTGSPLRIETPGAHTVHGVTVTGIPTYHDTECGKKRGKNIVYTFDIDGIRVVHMGDIGHTLDDAAVNAIGVPDVLLVPIGGIYTVDAIGAREIVRQLQPRCIIPMHFKTDALTFDLAPLGPFLDAMRDIPTAYAAAGPHRFTRKTLDSAPAPRILVLGY